MAQLTKAISSKEAFLRGVLSGLERAPIIQAPIMIEKTRSRLTHLGDARPRIAGCERGGAAPLNREPLRVRGDSGPA